MDNENKVPEEKTAEPKEELNASEREQKTEGVEKTKDDCCAKPSQTWCTPERKKIFLLGVAIIVVLAVLAGYKYKMNPQKFMALFHHEKVLTTDEAKTKALDFINKNMVQAGTKVDITNIAKENGLYKMDLDVAGQKITAYMTENGSTFFPNGIDMNMKPSNADNSADTAAAKPVPKSDKPDVKLFVMSYCPYGTQMEKGILPVVKALGDKINFTLEFVDYSMHNDHSTGDRKELDENMRQYCIEKNQPTKLDAYLTCFLKKGQGTESACMKEAGVNAEQVSGCITKVDSQFNVTKDYNDTSSYSGGQFPLFEVNQADNKKYNVQGSPTLIINDTEAQPAGRDSASILKTICSAFNTEPKECQDQLSSTAPSPGFGTGTEAAGSSSDANCAN